MGTASCILSREASGSNFSIKSDPIVFEQSSRTTISTEALSLAKGTVQVVNDQYAGILYTGEIGRFSKYKA
jgi:hypothetical protein